MVVSRARPGSADRAAADSVFADAADCECTADTGHGVSQAGQSGVDVGVGGRNGPRKRARMWRDSLKLNALFYTMKRVGGGVLNFGAIKVMKFAAS